MGVCNCRRYAFVAEAAAAYLKAAQSDSPYHTDPSVYHRMGVAILRGDFALLSKEYNEKYGAKPASSEQKQMFERLSHLVDRTIDAYARAVALSSLTLAMMSNLLN